MEGDEEIWSHQIKNNDSPLPESKLTKTVNINVLYITEYNIYQLWTKNQEQYEYYKEVKKIHM